ncbi:MAG: hypothetical protein WDN72_03975 [Alphaproteobacteria bacterium]
MARVLDALQRVADQLAEARALLRADSSEACAESVPARCRMRSAARSASL